MMFHDSLHDCSHSGTPLVPRRLYLGLSIFLLNSKLFRFTLFVNSSFILDNLAGSVYDFICLDEFV